MKSEQRHRLETNVMAEHLAEWIDKLRPYTTSAAGIVLFVIIAMFAWSYLSSSSASSQNEAWDDYNRAVVSPMPNLELLRHSAEEHPGTQMQQLADITWADSQVWQASLEFLNQKTAAMEALGNATSRYQKVLDSTDDERLKNRARLGLARIYEMQNQLDKARAEYEKVTGGFADYAKQRANELGEKKTQDVIEWLATAEPPRRPAPMGPGTPGKTPPFAQPDVPLPNAVPGTSSTEEGVGAGASFDKLLQDLDLNAAPSSTPDRYGTDKAAPAGDQPQKSDAPATEPQSDKTGNEQPKQ